VVEAEIEIEIILVKGDALEIACQVLDAALPARVGGAPPVLTLECAAALLRLAAGLAGLEAHAQLEWRHHLERSLIVIVFVENTGVVIFSLNLLGCWSEKILPRKVWFSDQSV